MFRKIIKDKKGMTLVEAIIGVLLLGIASLMLLTGFQTCLSLISEANKFKVESARVSTNVEVGSFKGNHLNDDNNNETTKSHGSIILDNGVTVNGSYFYSASNGDELDYTLFVPSTIEASDSNTNND